MLHSRRHIDMGDYFQSRKNKWDDIHDEHTRSSPPQNSLLLFCDLILKYEKYKPHKEEIGDGAYSPSSSERTNDSYSSESDTSFNDSRYSNEDRNTAGDSENDSWDLITCHCMKPFKGRPMIECTLCGTWVHMSCAKIRPNNVPDVFICQYCREPEKNKRRSERIRSDDRRLFSA